MASVQELQERFDFLLAKDSMTDIENAEFINLTQKLTLRKQMELSNSIITKMIELKMSYCEWETTARQIDHRLRNMPIGGGQA